MTNMREAFEEFATGYPVLNLSVQHTKGVYGSSITQIMWDAWQAAWGGQQASIAQVDAAPIRG